MKYIPQEIQTHKFFLKQIESWNCMITVVLETLSKYVNFR